MAELRQHYSDIVTGLLAGLRRCRVPSRDDMPPAHVEALKAVLQALQALAESARDLGMDGFFTRQLIEDVVGGCVCRCVVGFADRGDSMSDRDPRCVPPPFPPWVYAPLTAARTRCTTCHGWQPASRCRPTLWTSWCGGSYTLWAPWWLASRRRLRCDGEGRMLRRYRPSCHWCVVVQVAVGPPALRVIRTRTPCFSTHT